MALRGIVGGGALLTVIHGAVARFVPVSMPPAPPGVLWWVLASNTLMAASLTAIALRSSWSGWRLAGVLFALLYVVNQFASLIEAAFFDFFTARVTIALLGRGLVVSLIFAPLLVALVGKMRGQAAPARGPAPAWPRRLALKLAGCGALYLVLYFAFGMAIVAYIRDFYAQKQMPSVLAIIGMQLIVRGPMFGAMMLLVTRTIAGTARTNALFAALVMSVIGGAAPLMIPNPYFPDSVRIAHFFEVTIENFIFGWAAGWWLTPREAVPLARAAQAR